METIAHTYQLIYAIIAIGTLISTTEYLTKIKLFASNGILSWDIQQYTWIKDDTSKTLQKLMSFIFSEGGLKYLFLLRCITIVALFLIPFNTHTGWLLLIIGGGTIYTSSLVTRYGSDGSDQMTMLIFITMVLCFAPVTNPMLQKAGLWFIAFQSSLSYATAGIAKLVSKQWRSSNAIRAIFSTKSYGSEGIAVFLKNNRWMCIFLSWNVMVVEALFPLCLILPLPFAIAFLIWGFIFHLLTAIIMGLNSFFWAFMATYPAIIFVNLQIHSFLYA